jgi:hypothetical protein
MVYGRRDPSRPWRKETTLSARVTVSAATLLMTLLGATPAVALPYIVNAAIDACGGSAVVAAQKVTTNRTPDDPLGTANCPVLCDKFVTACRGAVDASLSCWKKTGAKFAAVEAATCNVQSGAAKDACNDVLKTEKALLKVEVDLGRDNGRAYCETTGLSTCLASCN